MSRNVNKVHNFRDAGIHIGAMTEVATTMTGDNIGETLVKWVKKGYCFTKDEAEQIISILESGETLPERANKLIYEAYEMYGTDEGLKKLEHRSHLPVVMKQKLKNVICSYVNLCQKAA